MVICFVSSHRLKDAQHIEFLGNILIRLFNVLGNNTIIHLLYNGKEKSNYLIKNGIHLHPFGNDKKTLITKVINFLVTPYYVYCICKQEKVDIVINLSDHYYFFLACIGAKLAKRKCVARVVGILPYSTSLHWKKRVRKKLGMILEKISMGLSDQVICLSKSIYDTLSQRGNNIQKLSIISQGVDSKILQSRSIENIEKIPKRFLFVGRLVPTKGVEDCILAFLEIKNKFSDMELVIYGDGPERKRLERQYSSRNDVIFRGFLSLEQLAKVYYQSDVFILPSYSEGLPNVVLEAMASRVPVIASHVGGLCELLSQERGILFPPGNIKEITKAMERMIENQKLRVHCSEKAFDYVKKYHSFEAVRKSTIKLFERCSL